MPVYLVKMKVTLVILLLTICGGVSFAGSPPQGFPQRIVSLNLCADQLVLMLARPDHILALSRFSRRPSLSAMAKEAVNYPLTYGTAEEVFVLQPDLVLAGSFTARPTINLLRRLGKKVIELHPANSFEDIIGNITIVGEAVGAQARAARMITDLKVGLQAFENRPEQFRPLAALYYANGFSSGTGTLVDAIVRKAGLTTLGKKLGFKGSRKSRWKRLLPANQMYLYLARRVIAAKQKPMKSTDIRLCAHSKPVRGTFLFWNP